jgi:hypothetical protein
MFAPGYYRFEQDGNVLGTYLATGDENAGWTAYFFAQNGATLPVNIDEEPLHVIGLQTGYIPEITEATQVVTKTAVPTSEPQINPGPLLVQHGTDVVMSGSLQSAGTNTVIGRFDVHPERNWPLEVPIGDTFVLSRNEQNINGATRVELLERYYG